MGQPKGLKLLFFTELWERFGFYTVQTILILYMSKGLDLDDSHAYLLYDAFSSMLYLTPVIGGYIADRYIGFRQSVLFGAVLFMIGYFCMAIPEKRTLFLGMSIVVIANGFFKPNVSSIVGDLYTADDPRRDSGFTIFYMGINLGAFLPPLFIGALVAAYTWGSGFLIASMGMVVCLITFTAGKKMLGKAGAMPAVSPLHQKGRFRFYVFLIIGVACAVFLLHLLLFFPKETDIILVAASLAIVGSVLFFLFKERREQRKKMVACLILILFSVGFWAIYNQTFTSLMLFADRNMEKDWLGFTIDAEFTQFFNPFFIFLLSPFLSWFWIWLDKKRINPATPTKFTLGILLMSFGFLFLWTGVRFFSAGAQTSPWWLIGSYFLQTLGELFLSPIGLAMVTRLSPKHLVGMMMGVWFLTQSAAFAIGGALATLSDIPKGTSPLEGHAIYSHAFLIYGLIALVLAGVSVAAGPFLKRLIGVPSTPVETPKR